MKFFTLCSIMFIGFFSLNLQAQDIQCKPSNDNTHAHGIFLKQNSKGAYAVIENIPANSSNYVYYQEENKSHASNLKCTFSKIDSRIVSCENKSNESIELFYTAKISEFRVRRPETAKESDPVEETYEYLQVWFFSSKFLKLDEVRNNPPVQLNLRYSLSECKAL